jgi:hypothetical protein
LEYNSLLDIGEYRITQSVHEMIIDFDNLSGFVPAVVPNLREEAGTFFTDKELPPFYFGVDKINPAFN